MGTENNTPGCCPGLLALLQEAAAWELMGTEREQWVLPSLSLRVFAPGIGILRITERAKGATLAYLAEDRKIGAVLTWGPDSSPRSG